MRSIFVFLTMIAASFADFIRTLTKIFASEVSFQPVFVTGQLTPQISRPRSVFEKKPSNATGGSC